MRFLSATTSSACNGKMGNVGGLSWQIRVVAAAHQHVAEKAVKDVQAQKGEAASKKSR